MSRSPKPYLHKVVRWYTADGRRCPPGTPGAQKRAEHTDTYYANLPDESGKRRRVSLGTADLGEAWEELRRLLRERELPQPLIVEAAPREAPLTLSEHVERWRALLVAAGASEAWALRARQRVLSLAARAGWGRVEEITADAATLALAALQETLSARSRNHYRAALRCFCRWLVSGGKLPGYPLRGVEAVAVEGDVRHARRVLSQEEVACLFGHLRKEGCPQRRGMSGPCRALAYLTAMSTGLRAQEVRRLAWEDFDLVRGVVVAWARRAKVPRRVEIPLPSWLTARLLAWREAGGGLWGRLHSFWPGWLLRQDVEDAGLAYRTETPDGPTFVDFHALRHYYVTGVVSDPETDLRTALELSRLSSAELLLGVYGHARREKVRAAAERLPEPGGLS